MRVLFLILAIAAPGAVSAQDDQAVRLAIAERYLACFEMQLDQTPEARIACYDALAQDIPEWVAGGPVPERTGCSIKSWNFRVVQTGSYYITGETTCAGGRLNYRLYTAEDQFLTSGFTFIEGFAFQFYETLPTRPDQVGMRSTITP